MRVVRSLSLAVPAAWIALAAVPVVAQPNLGRDVELRPPPAEPVLELRDFPNEASPPLPDPSVFPVQLVLDDDGAEGVFGFTGGTARQFLWLNRFADPGPFLLREIWVLFPAGMDVPVGGDVQLAVYADPDGDPATGAQLLATYDETIQAADGDTFSVYPLPEPLGLTGEGDVLIGVVSRFFRTGVDPPPTQPAAIDTTASQASSYFALWPGNPPDPPDLASADTVDLLSGVFAGNFMIRGFGTLRPAVDVPVLGETGVVLLTLLLLAAAIVRLRR